MKGIHKTSLMALAACALAGCGTVAGSLGIPVGQENADYKVEGAGGVIGALKPGSAAESSYRYGFTVFLKKAPRVASVRIERVANGKSELVIDDSANPTTRTDWQPKQPAGARAYLHGKGAGNITWVGQSAPLNMTEAQAPWLYQSGNTRQHYRITIRGLDGKETVFEQPTMIPASAKQVYREILFK